MCFFPSLCAMDTVLPMRPSIFLCFRVKLGQMVSGLKREKVPDLHRVEKSLASREYNNSSRTGSS